MGLGHVGMAAIRKEESKFEPPVKLELPATQWTPEVLEMGPFLSGQREFCRVWTM